MDSTEPVPGLHRPGAKALLVASTGGHLSELARVATRMGLSDDSLWVTFRTVQSETMLRGRRVVYLPYIGPRDLKRTLQSFPLFRRLIADENFDGILSTGAAVATAAMAAGRLAGIPCTYIESFGRIDSPSATGRILERMPGVQLRTQHSSWNRRRWTQHPSVLEDFRAVPRQAREPGRLFVTLGTISPYRFDALVDSVLATGLAGDDTVWQLGSTTRSDLPGTVVDYLSPGEFSRAATEADAVITHAGVGTLVEMLGLGVYPVMAVRRSRRREHVDDHQEQVADLVNSQGIGCVVEAPELKVSHLRHAASMRIEDVNRIPEAVPASTP